jgi:ribosome-associated protein
MNDLVVNDRLTIPAAEIEVAVARSGGPGGQHVNKTETKIEVRWKPAESAALGERDRAWLLAALRNRLTSEGWLIVTSSETRSQHRNRGEALTRLADLVRAALRRPKRRIPTRPSRRAAVRRLEDKRRRGRRKQERRRPE